MLILSEGKNVLYDTASGTSIKIVSTALSGANGYQIQGADGTVLAVRDTREEAEIVLHDIAYSVREDKTVVIVY